MVKWIRIAFPPKIGGTLVSGLSLAGASETLASQFSCLAQPPLVEASPAQTFWHTKPFF
jgi:hypothetical protein